MTGNDMCNTGHAPSPGNRLKQNSISKMKPVFDGERSNSQMVQVTRPTRPPCSYMQNNNNNNNINK